MHSISPKTPTLQTNQKKEGKKKAVEAKLGIAAIWTNKEELTGLINLASSRHRTRCHHDCHIDIELQSEVYESPAVL